jgi:hypothetical protein
MRDAALDLSQDEKLHVNLTAVVSGICTCGELEQHPMLKEVLLDQLKYVSITDPRGMRWSQESIWLSLTMYCKSSSSYKTIRDMGLLGLPSEEMRRYKNFASSDSGFHDEHIQQFP